VDCCELDILLIGLSLLPKLLSGGSEFFFNRFSKLNSSISEMGAQLILELLISTNISLMVRFVVVIYYSALLLLLVLLKFGRFCFCFSQFFELWHLNLGLRFLIEGILLLTWGLYCKSKDWLFNFQVLNWRLELYLQLLTFLSFRFFIWRFWDLNVVGCF